MSDKHCVPIKSGPVREWYSKIREAKNLGKVVRPPAEVAGGPL